MTDKQHVTFVVFGGTGNLAKNKLAPAFAQLLHDKVLTKDSLIVGVARGTFTHDSYKALLFESAKTKEEKEAISQATILFHSADSSKLGTLKSLKTLLDECEQRTGHQRIFYLATSYSLFPHIVDNMVDAKINSHAHGVKIVFEKPFGSNLKTARSIEKKMHSVFTEDQMYRIDHYLGKETVQNILFLKYANPVLESLFNNTHVSKIEIVADEHAGVGDRLGYYADVGAVNDMIQSHLLQVAALTLMESPIKLDAMSVSKEKVKILKKLKLTSANDQLLGSYSSFQKDLEDAKLPKKDTETFARLSFICNTPKWKGVPIIVQTGKKLHKKYGQVVLHFKNSKAVDLSHGLSHIHHNKLVIDIHPTQDVKLYFNVRRRGTSDIFDYDALDFCGECKYGPNTTDGYRKMLQDITLSDKTLFASMDEVLASWKVIAPLTEMRKHIRHVVYEDGSDSQNIK